MQRLTIFPFSGPPRDELSPGLRVLSHGAYALYYQATDEAVIVVRVLHGARDIQGLAERGGLADR